jgi:hypothetical protein
MAQRRLNQWSVVVAGLVCNQYRIAKRVRLYRQQMRRVLYGLIKQLESEIDRAASDYLPLKSPDRSSTLYDFGRPLLRATNRTSFELRRWSGNRVVSRTRVWGRQGSGCGIDELLGIGGLGYWLEAAPAEGQQDAYERFVALVALDRELRGRGGIYGMVSNGLDGHVARMLGDEYPLSELLLVGTVEEATDAVVKELASMVGRYQPTDISDEEADELRTVYSILSVANAPDYDFVSALTEWDQALIRLSGAVYSLTWKELAARKLGVCENEEEVCDPCESADTLASVIRLPRASGERKLAQVVGI